MSRTAAIAYAIEGLRQADGDRVPPWRGLPLALLALVFLPVGRLNWLPGWFFIAFLVVSYGAWVLILRRVNRAIFRTRSRFQPGTKRWDLILVALVFSGLIVEIPLATFDAGRMSWSVVPPFIVILGYVLLGVGIALGAWAQAVNRFFEPGVRIQRERGQHVVSARPYAIVRHPGCVSAIIIFAGMALALASWWALVPAAWASAILILRTSWEDALLRAELDGYADYARRARFRLAPGIW
jgi:protein-S-isoprenylcysteine O-methyltransferase Ste14